MVPGLYVPTAVLAFHALLAACTWQQAGKRHANGSWASVGLHDIESITLLFLQ